MKKLDQMYMLTFEQFYNTYSETITDECAITGLSDTPGFDITDELDRRYELYKMGFSDKPEESKIGTVKAKLQKKVDSLAEWADESGSAVLHISDHPNDDKDVWAHRHSIMDALRKRGYDVNTSMRHGVLAINVSKNIELV